MNHRHRIITALLAALLGLPSLAATPAPQKDFFPGGGGMPVGVYYYPEQWPRAQWKRDMDGMADDFGDQITIRHDVVKRLNHAIIAERVFLTQHRLGRGRNDLQRRNDIGPLGLLNDDREFPKGRIGHGDQ